MTIEANPAVDRSRLADGRKRVPLSTPSRKLEVDEIPGFHLYWFLEQNVPAAIKGGYEFVKDEEVYLNQKNVGASSTVSGNADLGSGVKVVGGVAEFGGVEHLVLMKIRNEWYDEDRRVIEEKNASVMRSIFKDESIGAETLSPEDRGTRYVSKALFQRPTRKGK